jgi:O-antigen ligase
MGHYVFVGVTEATGGVQRVLAIYHSPNALALFVGRLIPIALALLLVASVWRRALAAASAATTGITLLLTFSRGAWLAVAGAVLALGWFLGGRARWLALSGTVAFVVLAVILLPSERLRSEATVSQRLYIWQASLPMVRDHPLFGIGLDNFLYHYPLICCRKPATSRTCRILTTSSSTSG